MRFFVEFSNQEQRPILKCVEEFARWREQILRNTYVRFGSVAASQHSSTWAAAFRCLPATQSGLWESDSNERPLSPIAAVHRLLGDRLRTANNGQVVRKSG